MKALRLSGLAGRRSCATLGPYRALHTTNFIGGYDAYSKEVSASAGENISVTGGIANVPNVKILSDFGGYIYLYKTEL